MPYKDPEKYREYMRKYQERKRKELKQLEREKESLKVKLTIEKVKKNTSNEMVENLKHSTTWDFNNSSLIDVLFEKTEITQGKKKNAKNKGKILE